MNTKIVLGALVALSSSGVLAAPAPAPASDVYVAQDYAAQIPAEASAAAVPSVAATPELASSSTTPEALEETAEQYQNLTLIAVPNSHVQEIVQYLEENNLTVSTIHNGTHTSGGVDGVQQKSFASIMKKYITPILKTGASVLGAFI